MPTVSLWQRLRAGLAPKLGVQDVPQMLVLAQRLTTTASERVQTHQPEMRLLVQRLRSDQQADRVRRAVEIATPLEQRRHLLEDRQELELELISPSDQPLLVAVVGQ